MKQRILALLSIKSDDVLVRQKGAALVVLFVVFGSLILVLVPYVAFMPAYEGKRIIFLSYLGILEVICGCCAFWCKRGKLDWSISFLSVFMGLGAFYNAIAVGVIRTTMWSMIVLSLLGSFSVKPTQFLFQAVWASLVLLAIGLGLSGVMPDGLLWGELGRAWSLVLATVYMAYQLSRTHTLLIQKALMSRDASQEAMLEAQQQRRHAEEQQYLAETASRKKGEFLANISHELRTPLNAILGYSEMLHEDFSDHPEVSTQVVKDTLRVHVAGRHLLELIQEVLNLSDIESGELKMQPHSFELETLCEDVVSSMELAAQMQHNELVFLVNHRFGEVYSDPVWVRQVLFNLLSNAIKFTQDGVVTASLDRCVKGGRELVCLRVKDTGVGMTTEEQERVFEEFVQANENTVREFGGTGLGLSLCYKLASKMGGEIVLESAPGEGTMVEFSFELGVLEGGG